MGRDFDERRNLYRILGVQPDADLRVIRGAWRTLMQKLRLHPDLGGDTDTAAVLNGAYEILRNPRRREAYDSQLLAQWNLRELAGARVTGSVESETLEGISGNRRNYYRVLGVQPDAHPALVQSAHSSRCQADGCDRGLLDEAFGVLSDALRREEYDKWLAAGRVDAKERPKTDTAPKIDSFCLFCRAPHCEYPGSSTAQNCYECSSPLNPVVADALSRGRVFERFETDHAVRLWDDWPGVPRTARLLDLTPEGLRLVLVRSLPSGTMVRIEAHKLDAVAEVMRCDRIASGYEVGVALLRANFAAHAGVFVDTSF